MPGSGQVGVLVVVSDPAMQAQVVETVAGLGYAVSRAAGLAGAIEAFDESPAQILVIDESLCVPENAVLCHRLRSAPLGDSSTVVALVAEEEADRLTSLFKGGVDDYVLKPVAPLRLASRLRVAAKRVSEHRAREAAVAALDLSQRRFTDVIESVPVGIGIHRGIGFTYVNPALVRMMGYDHADEMKQLGVLEFLHPDERAVAAKRIRDGLDKGVLRGSRQYRCIRRDGELITVRLTPVMLDDQPRELLLVLQDITEQQRLRASVVTSERMATIGVVAASVGHEINNPLTYVTLSVGIALRALDAASGGMTAAECEALRTRLLDAHEGLQRVKRISLDLTTFTRPRAETPRSVDVRAVLESAIMMASHRTRYHARVVRDYSCIPSVLAVESRLAQVFLNLLMNAAMAIPDGDVASNEIHVSTATSDGGNAVVEVADTGAGIPSHLLPRVFEPFVESRVPGIGSSLGLAVCHSIITDMGGTISARSEVGVGTTLRLELPAAQATDEVATRSEPEDSLQSQPPRVLVIDDERVIVALISRLLEDAARGVVTASSGRQALEILRTDHDFDIILCDLVMPEMSGSELYEVLVAELPHLTERVVFLSGGVFSDRAQAFLDAIPNRAIEKPFDADELLKLVASTRGPRG